MTLTFDTLNCRSTDVLCRKKVDLTGTHTWRSSPLRTAVCYCPISSPDEPPRQARVTHHGCVCQSLRSWLCSVETSASCYLFPFLQQRKQSVMINRLGSYRSRGKKIEADVIALVSISPNFHKPKVTCPRTSSDRIR